MSQSNSLHSRHLTPSKHHHQMPTKMTILNWLHSTLPHTPHITIESLGSGVIYCKILNHYVPGSILPSRIIEHPLNEYENCINLKHLQLALAKLRINVPFDIIRVARQRFNENWNLVALVYRHLEGDFRKQEERSFGSVSSQRKSPIKLLASEKQVVLGESRVKANQVQSSSRQIFQKGGLVFMVDRVKEILISNGNDTYRIQLIRKLFSIDEEEVKLEENHEEAIIKCGPPARKARR